MTNDSSLRTALTANAVFSLGSAAVLVAAPGGVSQLTGLGPALLLQIIGVGLALFAVDLLHQATRPRLLTWRALYASLADFSWVVGSVVLVIFFPALLTPLGIALVLAIAAVVLSFGIWQVLGISGVHRGAQPGEYRHCLMVATNTPAEKLWPVIADFGNIQRYASNLRSSAILGGLAPAVGAVRCCEDHAGRRWSEECAVFEENRLELQFRCDAPDFPFPVSSMRGGWQVAEIKGGSQVTIWWELSPKSPLLAPLLLAAFGFQADRDFPRIVQLMATQARGERRVDSATDSARGASKLLAAPC
jgi:hypothetical protein